MPRRRCRLDGGLRGYLPGAATPIGGRYPAFGPAATISGARPSANWTMFARNIAASLRAWAS